MKLDFLNYMNGKIIYIENDRSWWFKISDFYEPRRTLYCTVYDDNISTSGNNYDIEEVLKVVKECEQNKELYEEIKKLYPEELF